MGKIILAGMMGLLAIALSLAAFVAWRFDVANKDKEQDQEDRLLSMATRVLSVLFGGMALVCWLMAFATAFGAFG